MRKQPSVVYLCIEFTDYISFELLHLTSDYKKNSREDYSN